MINEKSDLKSESGTGKGTTSAAIKQNNEDIGSKNMVTAKTRRRGDQDTGVAERPDTAVGHASTRLSTRDEETAAAPAPSVHAHDQETVVTTAFVEPPTRPKIPFSFVRTRAQHRHPMPRNLSLGLLQLRNPQYAHEDAARSQLLSRP